MPAVLRLMNYFKTYFNITTQKYYIAKDTVLSSFLTAHALDILNTDTDYATQTSISYAAYSGNTLNNNNSTQKWVKPLPGLLNANIAIALIMYYNDGITENILLRVPNASISVTYGYPYIPPLVH